MLTVKTYLEQSTIHGIGLFCDEDILPGTIVWQYNSLVDLEFSSRQWALLRLQVAPQSYSNLVRYSSKEKEKFYLSIDNGQFMNHSVGRANLIFEPSLNRMVSIRLINRNEELLCNYFEYSDPDDVHVMRIENVIEH